MTDADWRLLHEARLLLPDGGEKREAALNLLQVWERVLKVCDQLDPAAAQEFQNEVLAEIKAAMAAAIKPATH